MYPPQFRAENKIQISELLGIPINQIEKKSSEYIFATKYKTTAVIPNPIYSSNIFSPMLFF